MTKKLLFVLMICLVMTASALADDRVSPRPRWSSLEETLAQSGYDIDTDSLVEIIAGPPAGPRKMAVVLLGLRDEKDAIPTLQRLVLNEADVGLRIAAAHALGRLGQASGIDILRQLCTGDERFLVASHLAELGDDAGLNVVIESENVGRLDQQVDLLRATAALFPLVGESTRRLLARNFRRAAHSDQLVVRKQALIYTVKAEGAAPNFPELMSVLEHIATNEEDPKLKERARKVLAGLMARQREEERKH